MRLLAFASVFCTTSSPPLSPNGVLWLFSRRRRPGSEANGTGSEGKIPLSEEVPLSEPRGDREVFEAVFEAVLVPPLRGTSPRSTEKDRLSVTGSSSSLLESVGA